MRSSSWRFLVAMVLISVSSLFLVGADPAAADTPFAPIFSTNAPGDIEFVSNTVATCAPTWPNCAAAQGGAALSNNNVSTSMVLVDVDADPTTLTSSSANYTLPSGGSVLWAGLYWAGYYEGPHADKDDIKFSTPASGGYTNLTATNLYSYSSSDDFYGGFVDVTAEVTAGGTGTYTVGDIKVTDGYFQAHGGWTLVVVEYDPAEPWKNLTVNQGFQTIGPVPSATIPISGFTAPPVGPINAEIGVVASEGDRGGSGDYAEFNGTRLTDANNPSNNFFNSTLSDGAVFQGGGNPSYASNTLGYDADIINTTGLVAPGSTTANVEVGTTGDWYWPMVVTTAIDIYVPNLTTDFVKTATDVNGEDLHPGDVIEYNIFFDNSGEDPAIDVMASDAIPAGTTYVPNSLMVIKDDSPAGPRTDVAGDDAAWFDGTNVNFHLGDGATAATGGEVLPLSQGGLEYEVSFQVTVDPGTEGTDIENEAEIDYIAKFINEPYVATSNTTSQLVEELVDLSIDKVDITDPVFAGSQITYQLNVDNDGPSAANNVVITDTLPAGTSFNPSASDGACSASGSTVTCSYPSIASGSGEAPLVVVDVDGDLTATSVCNQAEVASDTHEHNLKDNEDRECTEIEREVDLTLEKTAPTTISAGDQFTYVVTVENAGPSNAQNVAVGDTLPSGLTLISATPSGSGSCSGSVNCTWPEVVAGGSETITIVVEVPSGTADGTVFTNRVKTDSDDADATPKDNFAEVDTEVVTEADLEVEKTTLTSPVVSGENVSYGLSVTNNGPSDAQNVEIEDTVPAGLTFLPGLSSTDCSLAAAVVTCDAATLADGATTSFTVVFAVDSSYVDGADLENVATVDSDTKDPDPDNNSSETTDTVARQADLSIVKDDNTTTVDAGGQITYTINYSNDGPSDATGVSIQDTLPTGVTFASSTDCTASGSTVTCALGSVTDGAFGSVSFVVDVDPSIADTTQLLNQASIDGNEDDPDPDNNDSQVSTDVDRTSNLIVEKDDLVDPVLAGESITYRLKVTNLGPSTDTGIVLGDNLPAGTTFSSTTDPSTCSHSSGAVTCNIGTLLPNATYTVEVTVDVAPDLANGHILSNTATADGDFSTEVDDTEETTIQTAADLATTKSAPTTAVAGTSITYEVSVTNNGPSDAQNIGVTDSLPTGVTYNSHTVTSGTGTCSHTAPVVSCSQTTLADGDTFTVEIVVDIDDALADGTDITNKAEASSDTNDPDDSNDTDTAETTVGKQADLKVEKATITGSVLAGATATFEVTVTNEGPSTATGVTVNDTLPTGFTFNSSLSDSSCAAGITCTVGAEMGVGDTVTFTIVADVGAAVASGTYTNEATASGNETDPNSDNDNPTADVDIAEQANLAITKVGDTVAFVPGTTGSYTITVENNGPSDATNVVVSDELPSGVTFNVAGSDSACSESSGTVTCSFVTLAAGDDLTFTIAVDVAAAQTDDIVNTASVDSDTDDPDMSDNSSEDTTSVSPEADLSIVKTAATDVVAGETLAYTIMVRNDGPSNAAATTVTDVLPTGLTFVPTGSSAQCSATGPTVTCVVGTLLPNDVVTLTIVTDVAASLPHTTDLVNDASISSDTHDPDPSDNSSVAETTSSREVDVAIDKTASVSEVTAGTSFTYTITVTNAGPSDAANVSVADAFPAGVTASSVTTDFGICGNTITGFGCSATTMEPTDVMTITVIVDVDESVADGTTLENTAYVTTTDPDADNTNDENSADVDVITSADLRIEKVGSADDVVAGEPLTYTITITNDGPSDAQNVVLADTVPSVLDINSVTSSDMICTVTGQLIECSALTLADGDTATITIATTVDEAAEDGSMVSNTATVSSETDDPDGDNNSGTEDTGVDKLVDLEVKKTTTKTPAVAGETHPYQIAVANSGSSTATNVVITDTLPAGTTFNSGLSDSGCTAVGVTVTCVVVSLASGAAATINIVIDIPADHPDGGTIKNAASATSNEDDADPDNNEGDVTTPVENSADLAIVKDGDGAATAGLPYSWDLAIDNYGSSDAINVIVTDTLPDGTTFNAGASDPRCTASGSTVTCILPVLAANSGDTLTLTVDVASGVAAADDLENAATISSDTDDPNDENDDSSDTATVARDSELDISKSDISDSAIAGGQVQWEIKVDNLGPSDANNVSISDTLPVGFTFASVDNTIHCSHAAGVVSCLFPTIVEGSSETIIITADVDSSIDDATVITNAATAGSDSSDPVSDEETTTVVRRSDLKIEKTSDEVAVAGTNQTYVITVTNDGPSDADNVEVTDFLPAGVTFVSSTSAGCGATGAIVVCDLGTVANEASVTFDIVVLVTDASGTSPRNVASVDSDSVDPNEENNEDDDTTSVTFAADLEITKTLATDPIVPGQPVTWDIVVTNNGPSIANNVVVTDTLVGDLTFVAAGSDPNCAASGQEVTCTEASINSGDSLVFVLEADLASDALGTLSNSADVASDTPDPDDENNTASSDGEMAPQADLAVEKTSTTASVTAGDTITYDVEVTNDGPSDALAVVITDVIPANTTFVPGLSSSNCGVVGTNVECTVPVVPAGEDVSVALTFELAASFADGATLGNVVMVDSDTPDPDPENNGDNDDTPVETSADIGVVKSGPSNAVGAGEEFDYTVTLTNDGLSDSQNVAISDTLPSGTTFVAVDDTACAHSSGVVSCSYPTVADQAEIEIAITVKVDSTVAEGATITNSVESSSDTDDLNPDNDDDEQDATVERTADLQVTKTAAPQPVVAGTQLVYTLHVINNGPAISDNVELSDVLPGGTTFISADTGCSFSGGAVTCSAGSLDVGDEAEFDITVLVGANIPGMPSLENSATATGDDSESSTESEEVEVTTEADLSLQKVLDDELVAGEKATYTLTLSNSGPSDAQNVSLNDALPSGLTYVSDTIECDNVGAAISCDLGTVANGASVTVDVTVLVEPWVADGFILSNNAGVASDTDDPNAANNQASDSDDTDTSADLSVAKVLDGETLPAGQTASYTVEVSNDGPSDAQNVVVTDILPPGLTFSPVGSDTACVGSSSVAGSPSIACSLGTVAAGDTITLTIMVAVDASLNGAIENIVSVTSETTDPDLTNNESSDTSDAEAVADIEIEKVFASDELTPGTEVEWVITATNLGPATATDMSLIDLLPADLTYVNHTVTGHDLSGSDPCTVAGQAVSCLFDSVEVGDTITLTITTLVLPNDGSNEVVNTATVSSPQMVESAVSAVERTFDLIDANLVAEKVGPGESVSAGDEFDWTITVRNEGPDPVNVPVTVEDALPEGLTYISHSALVSPSASSGPVRPTCTNGADSISCEVPSLGVDETITIVVTTRAEETRQYENVATVKAPFLAESEPVKAKANTPPADPPSTAGENVNDSSTGPKSQRVLAFTGIELLGLLTVAGMVIGIGAGLVLGTRRRRSEG